MLAPYFFCQRKIKGYRNPIRRSVPYFFLVLSPRIAQERRLGFGSVVSPVKRLNALRAVYGLLSRFVKSGAFTDSNVVKETGIVVYIICNEHQIDLLQGSRADLLADEVDRILNNGDKPLFGLGGIKLSTAEEVQFNEGYSGWQIPYITHEMNREASIID